MRRPNDAKIGPKPTDEAPIRASVRPPTEASIRPDSAPVTTRTVILHRTITESIGQAITRVAPALDDIRLNQCADVES